MLIKCPECIKEVSDKATSCPNCGHPLGKVEPLSVKLDTAPNKRRKYKVRTIFSTITIFVGLFMFLVGMGSSNSLFMIIGGVLFVVGAIWGVVNSIGHWLAAP